MKKLLIFWIIILFIGSGILLYFNSSEKKETNEQIIFPDSTYIDLNPITVGLYKSGNLITNYKTPLTPQTDIATFTAIYSNEEHISYSYYQDAWAKYSNYPNIDNYKIGYYISFYLNDGTFLEKTVLDPSDMYYFSPYIFIYLYDSLHQTKGVWYSHIEMNEFNSTTLLTNIKLYVPSTDISQVKSPITLTVFTYDKDDFLNNKYIGKSFYTITIEKA